MIKSFIGHVYHQIGSLLPFNNEESRFLQVYFMGDEDTELNHRCSLINGLNREIIANLQKMLHAKNHLIQLFKYALESMPTDDYKIVIKADKTPKNHHKKCFNAPTINEIAIIMVNNDSNSRDIIIQKRDNKLQRVRETHRSYDPLQYPILFCRGEDGYHFNIKKYDPKTGIETEKKV